MTLLPHTYAWILFIFHVFKIPNKCLINVMVFFCCFFFLVELALNDFWPFFKIKSILTEGDFIPTHGIQKTTSYAMESLVIRYWMGHLRDL